jgi:hypothetical protein
MGKTCQICGQNSGMYPLCKVCNEKKESGDIVKCDKCGLFHKKECNCECYYTDEVTKDYRKICPKCKRKYAGAFTCYRGCDSETISIIENNTEEQAKKELPLYEEKKYCSKRNKRKNL